jgi:hypothetical protein
MNVRLAFAALSTALALLGWSLWGALSVDEVRPAAAASDPGAGTAAEVPARESYSADRVFAAVDKDPFHPGRRRPAVRFRLPSDARIATPVAAPGAPGVRVVGTAASPGGGGFAMCAWAGGPPRIVRIGERVGDWTLSKVTPGAAEFRAPTGTTVVVRVAKAGS